MHSSPIERIAGAAGVIFAIAYTTGVMLSNSGLAESNAEYLAYFQDSANQQKAIAAMFALVIAGVSFALFASGLQHRVANPGPGSRTGSNLVTTLASAAAVAIAVGGTAIAAISVDIRFGGSNADLPDGSVMQALESAGFLSFIVVGGFFAAAAIVAASLLGRATLPAWLRVLGFICGATMLIGIVIPPIGLPIWTLAASTVLLMGRASTQISGQAATVAG